MPARLLERYRRRRFAWLFAALLATIGARPVLEAFGSERDPFDVLIAASLAMAALGLARERGMRWLVALAGVFVVVWAARAALASDSLQATGWLLWAAVFALAVVACVRHALGSGPVDAERIFAALDAYLLAGLAFGSLYWVLERELPGSFGPAPLELTPQLAVYVSLATMSTLGPGNVVAMNGPARGLMTFEAVAGQIYLAVLVARLVSLYGQPKGGQAG